MKKKTRDAEVVTVWTDLFIGAKNWRDDGSMHLDIRIMCAGSYNPGAFDIEWCGA